jgi:UPF0755 protein
LFAILATLGAALAIGAVALSRWANQVSPEHDPVELELTDSTPLSALAENLATEGLIDNASLFQLYAALVQAGPRLEAGHHLLVGGLSPAQLMALMTRGPARPTTRLTIPEGYDQFQIAERVQALGIAGKDSFVQAATDPAVLSKVGIAANSAEGYLFPATYEFYLNSHAETVLRRLAAEGTRRYEAVAKRHSAELKLLQDTRNWSRHEILTLASIVEKEAANESEHGPIASVFFNRLTDESFRPRHRLQSDPTAAYGCRLIGSSLASCNSSSGRVTATMLRDPANPYNTYKIAGLPPGPIANPSESALLAVIAPPQTPYFFFVANGQRRHVFSRTLSEHRRAIRDGRGGQRDDLGE